MLKVAVIGCGGIGRTHCNAWKTVEGAELVAVVDMNEEKAKTAAADFGCKWYTSLDDLTGVDAVSVVTPPAAHYAVVKAALNKGLHVFCEKPLTLDEVQGQELDALAKAKGLQLGVGFKMRFEPIFREAKKYLPQLGKLRTITSTKVQPFNPRPEGAWVKATGAMYELSIHDFDLITFLTGLKPQEVLYSTVEHRFGWEKEDCYNIIADYGEGVTAQLTGLYAVKCTFCYRDLTFTFIGDNGYIRVERPDRIVVHTDHFEVVEVPSTNENAFALELTHFKNAIEGTEVNTLTAEDANTATWFINEAFRKGSH